MTIPPRAEAKDTTQLVTQNLSFADAIACTLIKKEPSHIELEDVRCFARAGLFEASQRFDPARDASFRTFAFYRIRGSIKDGVKQLKKNDASHFNLNTQAGAEGLAGCQESDSLDQGLTDSVSRAIGLVDEVAVAIILRHSDGTSSVEIQDDSTNPQTMYETRKVRALLEESLQELSDDEEAIVRMTYFEGLTLTEAAAKIGKGTPWACRLRKKALVKLATACRDRGLDEPSLQGV